MDHSDHPLHTAAESPPEARAPDRLINAKQLKHRVLFSLQHIYRLEERGEFPRRIHLGKARVAWSSAEVTAWMQSKFNARGPCPFCQDHRPLAPDDRFIGKKELKELVLYSPQHVRLLELEHQFPARVWIGENRVAWLEREIKLWRAARNGMRPNVPLFKP